MASEPKRKRQKESVSQKWRTEGNELYKSAHAKGINCFTLASRMKDAITSYHRAFNTADDDNELASAARNLGVVNWKLVFLQKCTGAAFTLMQYSFTQGISYLCKAHTLGTRCKDVSWQTEVNRQLLDVIDEAFDLHHEFPFRQRLGAYEEYVECMPESSYKARGYLKLANSIFHDGITCLHKGEYKACLNSMRECYRPIEEAKRLAAGDDFVLHEVGIQEEDCFLHTCCAESIQARAIGDELFEKNLQDEEQVLMSGVYDALDWYKKAILLTRENDVEMEAIAHSRIGVVYDQVLKKKDKAHDYFKRSVDLAGSMTPRNFGTEDWFKAATSALQRYQQEVRDQEDAEWNRKREKYLPELKTELEKLRGADKADSDSKFLRFVYESFPPKRSDHKLELEEEEKKKKKTRRGRRETNLTEKQTNALKTALKKSLVHYHPDKQKEHGEKWVVLCEEIEKRLTCRYNRYKCV